MPWSDMEKKRLNTIRRKTDPIISVRDKLYNVWRGVKKRCLNPNHYAYHQYGGRGITICDEWISNFQAFYEWALNNGYRVGLTLDRINNNGNYEPNNCRWATWKEQGNNRRTNVFVTFNGKTKSMSQWADELGITREALYRRIHVYNMPLEMALTAKKNEYNRWNRKENFIK